MSGATPQSCQTKLAVGVEGMFFEKTSFWVEKLANEWKVETRLPFLNQCQFKAAKIGAVRVDRDWCPSIKIVMFLPISKCKLSMNQSFIGELEKFSGTTMLSIQHIVHGRAQVELRLQIDNMGETDVDSIRLVKRSGKLIVGGKSATPQMGKIRAAFQN